MAEDAAPTSIAARIAALKLGEVGRLHSDSPPSYDQATATLGKRPPPPPAPIRGVRPDSQLRRQSANVPVLGAHRSAVSKDIGNQPAGLDRQPSAYGSNDIASNGSAKPVPALPPRRPTNRPAPELPLRQPSQAPPLPSRRPSEYSLTRRDSNDSLTSTVSARSSVLAVPPLPIKRQMLEKEPARAALKPSKSTPTIPYAVDNGAATIPALPALPARPSAKRVEDSTPQKPPRRSALEFGLGQGKETTQSVAGRPGLVKTANADGPPPVPRSSRPDLSQLRASKPNTQSQLSAPSSEQGGQGSCLKCRDFSAADDHATKFPRQSIPSNDLGWIANQLVAPFPSHTDKARAIFTWLHHNIDYDTAALYNNNLKGSTPASTIASGLAVCEGYAGLFAALATKGGLEAIVVGGHGKGVGYAAPSTGAPLPPFDGNHAWNAVRIDDGVWKLTDTCWGAGHIEGWGQPYKRAFHPEQFTNDNDEFGRSHYPADASKTFRCDGRRSITWDEYLLGDGSGEPPRTFGGYLEEEGVSKHSIQPATQTLSLRAEAAKPFTRFTFQKTCPHWDPLRNGKGAWYCYMVQIGGRDGREARNIPFESNGMSWWVDVPAAELGAPGQRVKVAAVNSFDGKDGRGVKAQLFREKNGKVGMGWGYVAEWEIVS